MVKNSAKTDPRDRLAAAVAAKLPADGRGLYEVSAAFLPALMRPYLGLWAVAEHRVDGVDWLERHLAERLKGREVRDPAYAATYRFSERLCVKRLSVTGRLVLPEGETAYDYRMAVALEWRAGPAGELRVTPALGYQATLLAEAVAAWRELEGAGEELAIRSEFEGGDLILREGGDVKRLRRLA